VHAFVSHPPTTPVPSSKTQRRYARRFGRAHAEPHCAATERAPDEWVAVGGLEWCGSIKIRPVLPGAMGESTLRPGSGDRLKGVATQGAWRPGALRMPFLCLDKISAGRSQVAGRGQDWTMNPDRVTRLRSHNTPSTGFGSEALPCRSPMGPRLPPTGPLEAFARPQFRAVPSSVDIS